MPTFVKIGGSPNITINASNSEAWELTGLDANGNVLQDVNVQIVSGDSPLGGCDILLPTPKSLNYRKVTFNIVNKGYSGSFNIVGNDATINGYGGIIASANLDFPYILTLINQNIWSLPAPKES